MSLRVIASGRSCLECRRRKIKCDRSFPCAYCVKVRVQCSYPQRRAERSGSRSPSPRRIDNDLERRVERIENSLESLGRDFSQIRDLLLANASHSSSLSRNNDAGNNHQDHTHDEDNTQYIGPSPSVVLDQEVNSDHNDTETSCSRTLDFAEKADFTDVERGVQLRSFFKSEPVSSLESLRPSPVTISFYGKMQKQVMNLVRGRKNHVFPAECLMFAIYYSTILTMDAAECQEGFEEDKEKLLDRYRTGVENALLAANIVNSLDLSVLQALLIYLICGRRDKDGPNVRKLMGLVIGMAVRMGLHHDGEDDGIARFEVEMRRRLWWHICILDARAAESDGSTPCILESLFDTKLPTNASDASLDPAMSAAPQPQAGKTEMLFSLIRFEVSYFGRQIVFSDQFCRDNKYPVRSPLEKCRLIEEFRASIETRYLCHCNRGVPLDFVTLASTRLILVRFKLTVVKPRAGPRQKDTAMPGNFRGICVDVLQHARALRGYENGKQWLWLFQTYVEWEALACLLLDLCLTLSDTPDESAWEIVEDAYNYWKQHKEVNRCRGWGNIEELYAQALTMRDKPETIMPTPVSYDQDTATPDVGSSEHLSRMWELANAAAVTAGINLPSQPVMGDEAAEMPTSGTACEWSVGVFGQYFEMMDNSSA